MENRNNTLVPVLVTVIIFLMWELIVNLNEQNQIITPQTHICKDDSLKSVISNLQSELQIEEDGWDKKEIRYDEILFEYEYGLDHLKDSHPDAYREFHRIIGFKEKYSRELERDNKKRINIKKL
jgi:hypothetical protein